MIPLFKLITKRSRPTIPEGSLRELFSEISGTNSIRVSYLFPFHLNYSEKGIGISAYINYNFTKPNGDSENIKEMNGVRVIRTDDKWLINYQIIRQR